MSVPPRHGLDREPEEGFTDPRRAPRTERVVREVVDDGSERLVLVMRTHLKSLIGPAALSIFLLGLAYVAWAYIPHDALGGKLASWTALGLAVLAIVLFAGPWLNWWFTRYQVTTKRISYRTGILARKGKAVPLTRITDVSFDQSVIDRIFRCGTLLIADPATRDERGLEFKDIPRVHSVSETVSDLVFRSQGIGRSGTAMGWDDDGGHL